jgi:hypothetical protein
MPHLCSTGRAALSVLRLVILVLVLSPQLAAAGSLAPTPAIALAASRSLPGSAGQDCAGALATPGVRWDGLETEPLEWDGVRLDLEPLAGSPVQLCVASGPFHLLPATNGMGCLLVGGQLATVDGKLACGPFRVVRAEGDAGVQWQTQVSAAAAHVQPLWWNGQEFEAGEPYLECWDGTRTGGALACPIP